MAREINLVPDVKEEMIKALKLRNFILFLCIVVAISSVGVTLVLGAIVGAQQLAVDGKKSTIDSLSAKVKSYGDLTDFLTIKDQLGNLQDIANNKKVLSRTFNILSALIPTGADTITISALNVSLAESKPSFYFDAQANAGREPFIDYNVLDSFKKSMQYMRYDYGRYVDAEGNEIPTYCIIESGNDGATFTDPERGIYALWTINSGDCNPAENSSDSKESEEDAEESSGSSAISRITRSKTSLLSDEDYEYEMYGDEEAVRIWRTPQYDKWYRDKHMTETGDISGVPHFKSSCTKYQATKDSSDSLKWESINDSCLLVPDGIDGINIIESSNGRAGDTKELVLRFSARITLNPEVYKFNNKHMLAIGPEGRHNVTDSYTQIQAMFSERAADCSDEDEACKKQKGEE